MGGFGLGGGVGGLGGGGFWRGFGKVLGGEEGVELTILAQRWEDFWRRRSSRRSIVRIPRLGFGPGRLSSQVEFLMGHGNIRKPNFELETGALYPSFYRQDKAYP